MGFLRKGETLADARVEQRYRIRIETVDGRSLYWHKRGELHIVDEDVALVFVRKFNPDLFEVNAEGGFESPTPGRTTRVAKLSAEPL